MDRAAAAAVVGPVPRLEVAAAVEAAAAAVAEWAGHTAAVAEAAEGEAAAVEGPVAVAAGEEEAVAAAAEAGMRGPAEAAVIVSTVPAVTC